MIRADGLRQAHAAEARGPGAAAPAAVRTATMADFPAIRDLLHESDAYHARHSPATARAPDSPRFTREELAELLGNDRCLLLVAETAGAVAGFLEASLRLPDAPDEPHHPWCGVNNLAVREGDRRRGLGSALMRGAERWARRKGVTQLRLTVYEVNAGARAFYERLGYATHARELIKTLTDHEHDSPKQGPLRAEPYAADHLDALRDLINLHVGAAVPGWWLPSHRIAATLERNRGEYIVDPWVAERATFVVGTPYRLRAAVHVLRYRDDGQVAPACRGVGSVAWVVGRPDAPDALGAVLQAADAQLTTWGVPPRYGWDVGLPVPALAGVAAAWPHIAEALTVAGYTPGEADESLYGGRLDGIPLPGGPPLAGLTVRRVVGRWSALFLADLEGEVVGRCEVTADLTNGGERTGLRCWAELDELYVEERWRNRRVGTWLLRHGVQWLRLAGCDRIVLAVGADDEARGAGRFYRRSGWGVFVRETRSWRR